MLCGNGFFVVIDIFIKILNLSVITTICCRILSRIKIIDDLIFYDLVYIVIQVLQGFRGTFKVLQLIIFIKIAKTYT